MIATTMKVISRILLFVICSTAILATVSSLPTNVINKCPQPSDTEPTPPVFLYGHPDDCQYFYLCFFGTPFLMTCPATTSFSDAYKVCVHRYSPEDTCSQENAVRECSRGASIIAHPKLCHRYYNCSSSAQVSPALGQYEDECPYSQLFDISEKTCKPYQEVDCLSRVEVKDKCEYVKVSGCTDLQKCQECYKTAPSCIGLNDGFHPNAYKLWTPYYIECEDERVTPLNCQPILNLMGIFSPEKNQCVSLYEVTKSQYIFGRKPSCAGRAAGTYAVAQDTRVYYTCPGPQVAYCPEGTRFNEQTQQCIAS